MQLHKISLPGLTLPSVCMRIEQKHFSDGRLGFARQSNWIAETKAVRVELASTGVTLVLPYRLSGSTCPG